MENIKFISYDGHFPIYCSGRLVVEIDGKQISFGYINPASWQNVEKADYPHFWWPGGCEWEMSECVNEKDYTPEIFKILPDILKVMNKNIEGGCCGGCQ